MTSTQNDEEEPVKKEGIAAAVGSETEEDEQEIMPKRADRLFD